MSVIVDVDMSSNVDRQSLMGALELDGLPTNSDSFDAKLCNYFEADDF
jgi:hypothetical protein